ncbi:SLATT domain-containing protein [Bacillus marinisedimentorum]|uniref:SLATT domain-containing protein n=1 Tax=Bacillus marinisedimentorum TaxID=1821260 RepID=UPI0007DF67E0|nr:SLATT domain-containing protein [Bacillus marinisedimentorum]
MNNNLKEEIISLMNDRVWITKKARMEAEARMNRNHLFTQLLVNYYTFVVLGFSIWTLVSNNNAVSLLTVIASVGLFGVSIFVSAIGYREKALQFKESYLKLNVLEFNLKNLLRKDLDDKNTTEELTKYEKDYSEILTKSENHMDIDYIKVLIKHNKKITNSESLKYYSNKLIYYSLVLTLIVAPIILLILYLGGI